MQSHCNLSGWNDYVEYNTVFVLMFIRVVVFVSALGLCPKTADASHTPDEA